MNKGLCVWGVYLLLSAVSVAMAQAEKPWWRRGADSWYYKDDWKGLKIMGSSPFQLQVDAPGGAVGGWIVVWGEDDCRLFVNDRLVDEDLDSCLIWDYDLAPFLSAGPERVTLRLAARAACAEGEILSRNGTVRRFVTDANWVDAGGRPVKTARMQVLRSSDAFDRALNGRLLTYNDEERGKSTIAKGLARLQKLREQSIFLLRRLRPAEQVLSFEPDLPWRRAERIAEPLLEQARQILDRQSIPAQQAGRFFEAISTARQAETLIAAAEAPVTATIALYRGHREATHLANWVAMLGAERHVFEEDSAELARLVQQAEREHGRRAGAAKLQRVLP